MKIIKWLLIGCGLFVVALAFFISDTPATTTKKVPGSQPAPEKEDDKPETTP